MNKIVIVGLCLVLVVMFSGCLGTPSSSSSNTKYVTSVQMTYPLSFTEVAAMNFSEITTKLSSLGYTGQSHLDTPPPPATQTYQCYLYYTKTAKDNKFGGGIALTIAARNDTNATIFNLAHGGNPLQETNESLEYEKNYLIQTISEFNYVGNLNVSLSRVQWYTEYQSS